MDTSNEDAGLNVEPGVNAVEKTEGLSILDRAAARREERVRDESLKLDIPTWGGELFGKYRVVERRELDKMLNRIRTRQVQPGQASNESGAEADLDFLIKACIGVIAVDAGEDIEEQVSDGFNEELADKLGNPAGTDTARGLLLYLMKNNGISLASHAMKVARWMQDTSKPVDPQ